MIANLSIRFGGIKIATTQRNLLQYHKVKNFTFFIPKNKINDKLDITESNSNVKKQKTKIKKSQILDNTPLYKNFSKNMNQNSVSEKERLEKDNQEAYLNQKKKSMEEQRELNISRRSQLKMEKERNYKNRISNIEKPNRDSYSAEEFNRFMNNPKNSEFIFFKVNNIHRYKLGSIIRTVVFLVFPLTISGLFLLDYLCFDFKKISILMKFGYYFLISFDYLIFLIGVLILINSKNTIISAKIFPKDNILELSTFNIFGRLVRVKERVSDMKLNRNSWLNADDSIKSKRTNKNYIFKDKYAEINDKRLFNYLFPEPEVKERRKPSMVDSLWEKN